MRYGIIAKRFSFAVNAFLFLSLVGVLAHRGFEARAEVVRVEQLVHAAKIQREVQIRCLAENIYHEARGETKDAQRWVAMVTIARAVDEDRQWPKTVCEVVAQERQFSWVLEAAIATKRSEQKRWKEALMLAREIYEGFGTTYVFPKEGACIRFYARTDQKGMSQRSKDFFATLTPVFVADKHTFYRSPKGCKTQMATLN